MITLVILMIALFFVIGSLFYILFSVNNGSTSGEAFIGTVAVFAIVFIFSAYTSVKTLNDTGHKRDYDAVISSGIITNIEYIPSSTYSYNSITPMPIGSGIYPIVGSSLRHTPPKYAIKIRSLEPINDAGEYVYQTITVPTYICARDYKVGDIFDYSDYTFDERNQIYIEDSYIDQYEGIPYSDTATNSDVIYDTGR